MNSVSRERVPLLWRSRIQNLPLYVLPSVFGLEVRLRFWSVRVDSIITRCRLSVYSLFTYITSVTLKPEQTIYRNNFDWSCVPLCKVSNHTSILGFVNTPYFIYVCTFYPTITISGVFPSLFIYKCFVNLFVDSVSLMKFIINMWRPVYMFFQLTIMDVSSHGPLLPSLLLSEKWHII